MTQHIKETNNYRKFVIFALDFNGENENHPNYFYADYSMKSAAKEN